jgi:hypothetical protein
MELPLRDHVLCRALIGTLAIALAPAALFAQWAPGQPPPRGGSSTLPATAPTSQATPISATAVSRNTPLRRAEVSYTDGLLDIRANNSSLHQILRAISRRTGMTISGNIVDDRVFGNYGPATPSTILATLIDGTGTNMLLREGDATHPMVLVLTPQTAGPSPPNATPIAADADDAPEEPAQQPAMQQPTPQRTSTSQPTHSAQPTYSSQPTAGANPPATTSGAQNQITNPPSIPQPLNNVNGSPSNTSPTASTLPTTNSVPIDSIPTPSTTPSSSGIVDSPNPPAPGSTTGTSPNGVKTPQQIYQQLLQMQQQQQTPQQTAPASTTPAPQ